MTDLLTFSTLRGNQRVDFAQGPQGISGTSGSETTYGPGIPDNIVGSDGDVYLQRDATGLILKSYQKLSGIWTLIGDVQDPNPWVAYTPAVVTLAGSLTTASAIGRYKIIGNKTINITILATITTNGTGSNAILLGLPFDAATGFGAFWVLSAIRSLGSSVTSMYGLISTVDKVLVRNYEGSYPGADGAILYVSGTYERI